MICSLYGHLSVQYAETTNGVLPVQAGLSVHSLSCGRLCLPQVRIIFSHFPYIRAGIPRISAHYAEAIMDAICSSQIFGHSYSLTLSDCTDIVRTPRRSQYDCSLCKSGLRPRNISKFMTVRTFVRTKCRNHRNAARSGRAFGTTHQPDET